jgi:hypothetical protein
MRPGLTLPELLVAILVVGAVGTVLFVRSCPAPPLALTTPATPPVPPEPAPGNLLVNGSFEIVSNGPSHAWCAFGCRSLPGWQITEGTVDLVPPGYWEPAPGQGQHSLDLVGTPGAATIEQTFPTEPGREYCFSGWLAHNPEQGHVDARADVFLNGSRLVQLYHRNPRASNRGMDWRPFAYKFRADSDRTTLALRDVSGHGDLQGTALDGLAVTPVTGP